MRRRLLNLLTVLSVLLFAATAALSTRGYWWVDNFNFEYGRTPQGTTLGTIISAEGYLGWSQQSHRWTGPEIRGQNSPQWAWPGPFTGWRTWRVTSASEPWPNNVWPHRQIERQPAGPRAADAAPGRGAGCA